MHVANSVWRTLPALKNQSVQPREPKKEAISVTEALPRKGGRADTRTEGYHPLTEERSCLGPSAYSKLMTELKISSFCAWRKFGVQVACNTEEYPKGDG